jgi:outer membrane protein TolC
MKKNIGILTFCLFSFAANLNAQEIVTISKAEVLEKVSNENQTIKISNEDYNQALADYRQTNAVFLPNISVSHTGHCYHKSINGFWFKTESGNCNPGRF